MLHLGTVCKRKAQLSTAKAFSKLVTEHGVQNAKLLMVGARYIRDHEIAYIDEIKAEIAGAGLEDRFQLMDIQKEVLRFYLAADVVVVPSINEVLPLVICEAMAFERPVIASRIDGIPEAMDDGVEGFLIDAGNPDQLADRINCLYTVRGHHLHAVGHAGRMAWTALHQVKLRLDDLTSLQLVTPLNACTVSTGHRFASAHG